MNKIIFSIALSIISITCTAQVQKYDAIKTEAPASVRYEVVQSQILRSNTFLVDKYKGIVKMLVADSYGGNTWQTIYRNKVDTPSKDIQKEGVVNYQLFMGGTMARDCFLLNVNTGTTWMLVVDNDHNYSFELFE